MDKTLQTGFTLIELLVAMAVAAILLGIGIPSFSGAIKNSQVSSCYNDMTGALYAARSESVKSGEFVTVCPKMSVNSQQCGTNTSDWKNGWLVFVDVVADTNENSATINPEDEIVSIHPAPSCDNVITAMGSTDRTSLTATERAYIRYQPTGSSFWANGSIYLCNEDESRLSRVINIVPTGDVRKGRKSGSEYPRDVFSEEACVL